MTCKVIKGLMDPIVLGWNWMSKYGVTLDPVHGRVKFCGDRSVPLLAKDNMCTGLFYRAYEDITIPANSKVHVNVEVIENGKGLSKTASTVVTEPFSANTANYAAARSCSRIQNGRFMTEFVNWSDAGVKIPAGEVIGHAELVDDDLSNSAVETEMYCTYSSSSADVKLQNSADVSSKKEPASPLADNQMEEAPPQPAPPEKHASPPAYNRLGEDIPPGAKRLQIDFSKISEGARPYEAELRDLLENKRKEAFSRHDRDYGKTTLIQYRANMKDPNQTPLAQPPYRTRPEMREIIDQQAHQMIADGLVGHSTSPYSAPIMLSKKKCGGWRFLTDFRKVNACCNKVVFPLPRIEDSIQRLEKPQFFTSMDLTKGFWQIPVHPDDRRFFAFSTESLHLEYLVAPMGAKNSPSCLSALMQLVLRGLPIQHVISYLDDILVADTNMRDHLKHLDLVLSAMIRAGLKLNPAKCAFARDSVVCLGHHLSKVGISPDPANVEKIKSWKAPTTVKQVRAFLGLTGYYRSFIQGYSDIANCLTNLTKDATKWRWGQEEQTAFETLRAALTSDKVMSYPNFNSPFIVKTDASLTAIGYVLTQKIDNQEKVISYGSKKLSDTQRKWSTYDRKLFAIITAVRANNHYLRHAKFHVVTDHRPLLSWRKVDAKKDPTGRRTRWAIELDAYDFDLTYKKGVTHCDADAMSRRGDEDDETAEDTDNLYGLYSYEGEHAKHPSPLADYQQEEENPPIDGDNSLYLLGAREDDEHPISQYNHEKLEMLRKEQNADPILSEVKSFIKARKRIPRDFPGQWFKRNGKWLTVRDDVLYRKSYAETIDSNILQAIIPDSMTGEVLNDLHGSEWAGHPSVGKMLLKAQRYATWPSLPRDAKEKVKNCLICDQLREQVPKPSTPLQPIIATRVFDHVMCDLISFTEPSQGFKYVLIFKDVFSGFIKSYKL